MQLFRNAPPLLLFCGTGILGQGCGYAPPYDQLSGQHRQDNWTIVGKVSDDSYANGEVIAVSGDGSRFRTGITEDRNFGLELPGNTNYAMHFLSESEAQNPHTVSKTPTLLHFEDTQNAALSSTLRLPEPMRKPTLDLGDVDIMTGTALPTKNPAARLDFDRDGIKDFKDRDDQNDGLDDQQIGWHEKIQVCHTSDKGARTTIVKLSELFTHIEHGDTPWPCRKQQLSKR